MKSIIVTAALSGFLFMGGGSATAGARFDSPVLIQTNADGSGEAFGSFGATRNSADQVEFIACTVGGSPGSGISAACGAMNAAGTFRSCFTSDPALLEVLKSMTSDPFITFVWDAQGRCIQLDIETGSYYGPRLP